MPMYEYECTKCGEKFEVRRSIFAGSKKTECPKCGAGDVQRVYSVFSRSAADEYCAPSRPT